MVAAVVSRSGQGIARGSCGTVTGDGTALTVTLGFKPKRVILFNLTDVIKWEKLDPMPDVNSIKTVAAGTMTNDATSAIVLTASGFTTSAALAANAKVLYWVAL